MFDRKKFKALILHAIARVDDPSRLGAVKLNKILWYVDGGAYLRHGESITGARYIKKAQGPVPKAMLPVMRELQDEGIVAVETVDYYGKGKRQFRLLKEAPTGVFNDEEMALIGSITDAITKGHTAVSISNLTHGTAWKLAEDGEDLPFFAYLADELQPVTDADIAWAVGRMREADSLAA